MQYKKIIIKYPNWLGDAIMALPFLEIVKKQFPFAEITIIANPSIAQLFYRKDVRIVVSPRLFRSLSHILPDVIRFFNSCRELKKGNYDLGLLLTNSFDSGLAFFLSQIPRRIGWKGNFRSIFLTDRIATKRKEIISQYDYFKAILNPLNSKVISWRPEYTQENDVAKEVCSQFLSEVNEPKYIVGIAPGANYGPAKKWPAGRFAAVAKKIVESDCAVVLLGTKEDEESAALISASCSKKLVNTVGKTSLDQAVALISFCDLVISNDSGVAHLSGALQIPTIILYGSTDPKRSAPNGKDVIIVRKKTECAPCFKRKCSGNHYRCLKAITVEDILKQVNNVITLSKQ